VSDLPLVAREPGRGDQHFYLAAVALLGICYLFSPLVSFVGALLYLTVFSRRLNTPVRVATSVVAIVSAASIWASREVGRSVSDDLAAYYDIYSRLGMLEWGTERIPVYEFGLPLLLKIIRVALPDLTPNGLMFVLTTVTGLTLLFCVERFGLREFPREKRGYCAAMVLLFFSFVLTTQLTRQMLSSVLLVNIFFCLRAVPTGFSVLLASLFHVSAVAVYAVVRVLRSKYLLVPFVFVAVFIVPKVLDLAAAASLVTAYDVPRVGYYVTAGDSGANAASLGVVLVVGVTGLLSLLAFKAAHARILSQEKGMLLLLAGVIIAYLLTLDVTLGPFRLFLVFHAVMAGWFFAYFTRRFPTPYLVVGGVALILWRTRSLYILDPASAFVPWDVYGAFGAFPGYFVLSYFTS